MRNATPDALATPSTARDAADVADSAAIAFECAQRDGTPFSLASFAIEGVGDAAELASAPAEAVRALARLALEGEAKGRVFAWRHRAHLVVAFEGATLAHAEQRARHVLEAARGLPQPTLAAHAVAGLASVQAGSAFCFDVLLAVAEEGVAVASASGFGGVAHTELYGLVERKLARTRGPYQPRADLPPPAANVVDARPSLALVPAKPRAAPDVVEPPVLTTAPATAIAAPAVVVEPTAAPIDEDARQSQIEMYERRIAKLLRALEEAQRELSSRASAPHTPTSSAPIAEARTRTDDEIEEKRALFAKLLEQNLALRDALRRAS